MRVRSGSDNTTAHIDIAINAEDSGRMSRRTGLGCRLGCFTSCCPRRDIAFAPKCRMDWKTVFALQLNNQ